MYPKVHIHIYYLLYFAYKICRKHSNASFHSKKGQNCGNTPYNNFFLFKIKNVNLN